MKLMNISLVFSSLVILASCASHDHVRAGADGIHHVIIRGPEKDEVEKDAIAEAKSFCDERNLAPAFVEDKTNYTGSMSESTHKAIQKASKAAQVGGGMVGVFGGTKERNIGQGVFGAGTVGSVFQDGEAYTADMRFKCI
jgi:hypothetical protein